MFTLCEWSPPKSWRRSASAQPVNMGKPEPSAWARYFEGLEPPARACVAVKQLPKDVDVEIECVALA